MNAKSLSSIEAQGIGSDYDSGGLLPRLEQIRCHLGCVGRQIKRGRVRRLPFHLFGIFRAVCGSL
ncbi:MAG TPA: hypothetical protein VGA56_08005 [Opitutaceae bacterium]